MNEPLEHQLKELTVLALQGDTRAYARLLDSILPFVRRCSRAHMARFNRIDSSEDVVQETLLAVHLKLHTFDETQPFLAWLRTVLKHKCIDHLRRCRVMHVSLTDFEGVEPEAPDTSEATACQNDLFALLSQLKPPSGDIIYDMKVEGQSVQELSKKYNLSESNIKVLVHRGLQALSRLAMDLKQGHAT